ncbi:MAG TPA: ATP-binding protein [Sphingomicrobium sp.]|nr:ATP-binding protein [Sphingomicrobium sp.]
MSERALLNALDEPALVVERGTVKLANRGARRLLGGQIEGRDVRLAIRHPQALEQILAHRSGDVEVTGIADPGRPWRLSIRDLGGGAVLVRMVDRTELMAAEKMRVDFVANASHELRTPLSAIIGYAETLAEEGDIPAETRIRFGTTIRNEAQRMLRIVEDLMSLSRIEADRFRAPSEDVSLAEVVRSSVANAAAPESCTIDLRIADDLPPVRGDHAQLAQLVDNLLSNALRYGCGSDDARVDVELAVDGGWVSLGVTDRGPGIPRQHIPRITERFYRVDAARSRESGGTGLGLAIVKHIVERHRGALDIRSTVGVGTSVTVRLPASERGTAR